MPDYCHLHNHTQYSLLDGASDISKMMKKAKADGQTAVALTDHGNMYGAFKFVEEAKKNDIKPIIGCEFYLVADRHKRSFSRAIGESDKRYHQLLLAKNALGYSNLAKMCSVGFTEGLYQKFPRIDKEIIEQYHEGVIATSCCIGAEVPQAIMRDNLEEAEVLLKWWLDIFGEDYYIELQRHQGLDKLDYKDEHGKRVYSKYSQEDINQILLGLAKKYNVKVIATNDSHYVEEEDYISHDILLCINTGNKVNEENRFKFASSDFYFKSQKEMNALFADVPESIATTMEIADKIDTLDLARDIVLPEFPLPSQFKTQDDYLKYLTFEGAKGRYSNLTAEIESRLIFELSVISQSGYPGYFLIVHDLIDAARKMGVVVGPGRGSAAGSAVAYCLGITNIDPIKYDLLFERFLNPERVSMPDIDIDFDDEGRSKVIDYVIDKYGQNQVAQIITYGTMAAKSSIRDVGRALDIPLHEVDRVAKSLPQHLSVSLNKILKKDDIDPKLKSDMNKDDVDKAYQFRKLAEEDTPIGKMIASAKKLEGNIRNTGIHACGVIITPDDITNYVPVGVSKDSSLRVSQFDNSVVEDSGLLKMDFLGLRNLTIIKTAVKMIDDLHGVKIDIDDIPLDDEKTFELFQRGDTKGIFQFESDGMASSLKMLKPTNYDEEVVLKIWKDWEKFASYAFNKSHATCYTYIAWQTAYLKTHYPAEYMASLLNNKKSNIKSLNFYLTECEHMGLLVLGPSVNESYEEFRVTPDGNIRFGLSGLKGVGSQPVAEIVAARDRGVKFESVFDLTKEVNLRVLNKRVMESLAYSGAMDEFGITRSTYFNYSEKYETLLEHAIKYGQAYQYEKEQSTNSLFGDLSNTIIQLPKIVEIPEWSAIQKLTNEKEVTGMYISGHPLDDYKMEILHFTNCTLDMAEDVLDKTIKVAGIVTEANHGISRSKGTGYCRWTIQDTKGSFSGGIYRDDYLTYKDHMQVGQVIYMEGVSSKNQHSGNVFFKIKM